MEAQRDQRAITDSLKDKKELCCTLTLTANKNTKKISTHHPTVDTVCSQTYTKVQILWIQPSTKNSGWHIGRLRGMQEGKPL